MYRALNLDCLINRKGQCIRAVTPLSWVPWVPVNPSIFERKQQVLCTYFQVEIQQNLHTYIETDSKKSGQDQKLTANKKSTIFELSS